MRSNDNNLPERKQVQRSIERKQILTNRLECHPTFLNDVKELRIKWDLPEDGFKGANWDAWQKNIRSDSEKYDRYVKEIKELMLKYDLSEMLFETFQNFIENGEISVIYDLLPEVRRDFNKETGLFHSVTIRVLSYQTLKDVEEVWDTVKCYQQRTHDYAKEKIFAQPTLRHAKMAYDLRQKKVKYKDIAKQINREFGMKYDEFSVSKLIQRYKKTYNL